MRTRALSFHADYACRSSGACCTSGWAIAVEPEIEAGLIAAEAGGHLPRASGRLVPTAGLPSGARVVLATDACGHCAFYEDGARLCSIHRALGHEALPASCRHFPRVALLTPGTVSITLSHYCPTAAATLFDDAPVTIVDDPPGFPPTRTYEGLDARTAWPPLLAPGVLLGWPEYALWERMALDVLLHDGGTASEAVALLKAQVGWLSGWRATERPFGEALHDTRVATSATRSTAAEWARDFEEVCGCVAGNEAAPPPGLARADAEWLDAAWPRFDPVVRRYLAARLFASWVALQGDGLAAVVRGLEASLAVLRVSAAQACDAAGRALDAPLLKEAIRRSDRLLVHEARPEALARAWSRAR